MNEIAEDHTCTLNLRATFGRAIYQYLESNVGLGENKSIINKIVLQSHSIGRPIVKNKATAFDNNYNRRVVKPSKASWICWQNIIEELVYGDYRRAAGMVIPSNDTSSKGGQYHKPFYSRQIIKGNSKVILLVNVKVVMATTEELLVLSSLRIGVNASKDHTSSPSRL